MLATGTNGLCPLRAATDEHCSTQRHLGRSNLYFAGFVNLPRVRRHDGEYDCCSESSRRILGEFGEFAPCNEPGCEFFAIE
jgi:hypothetical protein